MHYLPQFLLPDTPCSAFNKNIIRHVKRRGEKKSKDTKQASESDPDKTQVWRLAVRKILKTMMNISRAIMKKVDNI